MRRVHHALALELHPHAVRSRTRELQTELDLRAAIGDERMSVDHIDQIVARRSPRRLHKRSTLLLHALQTAPCSFRTICTPQNTV